MEDYKIRFRDTNEADRPLVANAQNLLHKENDDDDSQWSIGWFARVLGNKRERKPDYFNSLLFRVCITLGEENRGYPKRFGACAFIPSERRLKKKKNVFFFTTG